MRKIVFNVFKVFMVFTRVSRPSGHKYLKNYTKKCFSLGFYEKVKPNLDPAHQKKMDPRLSSVHIEIEGQRGKDVGLKHY